MPDGTVENLVLADIPRIDRGMIWARAEEIQRINPHMTGPAVMFQALREYGDKQITASYDEKLINTVRDNPESMFRT